MQLIGNFVDVPVIMQRQVPQFQTVPKTGEAPQAQFIGKVVDVPSVNQATKHAWIPENMHVDKVVDMLVAMHQQVPQVQTVPMTVVVQSIGRESVPAITQATKPVEIPQTPHTDKVADVPAAM